MLLGKKNLPQVGKKTDLNSIHTMESNHATREDVLKEFTRDDFEHIITKLEDYARSQIKGIDLGIDPSDIVSNVLLSVLEEESGRNWDRVKCPDFYWFLFWAVKSHIGNLRKKHQHKEVAQKSHADIFQPTSIDLDVIEEMDFTTQKAHIYLRLKELGGDYIEELVLDCWFDDINKPQEIAYFLELTVAEVNNATKRIKRKLLPIQQLLKNL